MPKISWISFLISHSGCVWKWIFVKEIKHTVELFRSPSKGVNFKTVGKYLSHSYYRSDISCTVVAWRGKLQICNFWVLSLIWSYDDLNHRKEIVESNRVSSSVDCDIPCRMVIATGFRNPHVKGERLEINSWKKVEFMSTTPTRHRILCSKSAEFSWDVKWGTKSFFVQFLFPNDSLAA